jgi:bifunctional UDP-N-acetylglucosamine pyrophosphorylase/glucosamine-1-phosphate N-acetyltransferase
VGGRRSRRREAPRVAIRFRSGSGCESDPFVVQREGKCAGGQREPQTAGFEISLLQGPVAEESNPLFGFREIDEINTSIYCFRRSVLAPALRRLSPQNAQGEYYLTDVVEVLYDAGYTVTSLVADDPSETEGVNDRRQLAAAEAELRRRTNLRWLDQGINMVDPERTYIDATVRLATDVTLFPGTILQGATTIGERSEIGPNTRLVDCVVGADVVAEKTVAREAEIGDGAHVGPFAVLNPGDVVTEGARTGPFYTGGSDDTGA